MTKCDKAIKFAIDKKIKFDQLRVADRIEYENQRVADRIEYDKKIELLINEIRLLKENQK